MTASRSPQLDGMLSALADPTRRGVVELLRQHPRRAGELAAAFEVSPPAMSRHLRVLRAGGLVEEQPGSEDARVRVYRLRREPFDALRTWIEEVEAFWDDQLDSFRDRVEVRQGRKASRPSPALPARRPAEPGSIPPVPRKKGKTQ